ncbi:LysR family transcriptional regulator [Marinobacterium nitratireducens]|uniref:LysR family transcriptional regulator n=1 Tax=Marinobacterium nitratireducens TaxID=518897 RepID=A0A917ZPG4_9GAMM|nr:LysR family transcriptional regulator [Marinobacterium nitratireducens]GGO87612.1 LysR family transcriptional regulator [Marinobacterium nitratireducens]
MELSRINLNLLPALYRLLQSRSVSQAARALHVSQPAMSRNLAQLRELFGDPLLVRVGNEMQLTPRAEALAGQLPSLLVQIESCLVPSQFDPSLYDGRFNIAITDYISEHILPPLVAALYRTAPGLQLHFHLWEPSMIRDLREGRMDLAACVLDDTYDDIHGREVGQDDYCCLLRRGHPLLSDDALSLEDYVGADHISISGGGDKNRPLNSALAALGRQRRIHITVPFFQSALAFCASSDCLLTLPTHMAHNLLGLDEGLALEQRPLPFDVPRVQYSLIWHQRQQHDPAHRFLRQQFYEALRSSPFSRSGYNQS